MKNLLTFLAVILCSVGAFGQGAQYRPTPFANGFVQTVTSTGTAQTYLGIGSSTNNALLNAPNQVFTGTNTFAGGKVNAVTIRMLYQTNLTGYSITSSSTVGESYNTPGGVTVTDTNYVAGSSWQTNLWSATMPALQATNSIVSISISYKRTNAVSAMTGAFDIIVGTNWIGNLGTLTGTTATITNVNIVAFTHAGIEVFRNLGSMSIQMPSPQIPSSSFFNVAGGNGNSRYFTHASHVDTSAPWTLTVKAGWLQGGLTITNLNYTMTVIETVPPVGF